MVAKNVWLGLEKHRVCQHRDSWNISWHLVGIVPWFHLYKCWNAVAVGTPPSLPPSNMKVSSLCSVQYMLDSLQTPENIAQTTSFIFGFFGTEERLTFGWHFNLEISAFQRAGGSVCLVKRFSTVAWIKPSICQLQDALPCSGLSVASLQ